MEAPTAVDARTAIDALVRRGIFASEGQAVRELVRDYLHRQIASLQREVRRFERKYGMRYERFGAYLQERAALLASGDLPETQRQVLGRSIMLEEDDWLDWKAAEELLARWVGLQQEAAA